ncbi:hypothetical protein C0Q70_04947 [Pomacea canaliculata]|uniref:Uncharacterized protein n=1 Tax=Pomacea canaliculata TaxID=400727 RepID=A0A2T7PJT1_POMCA|nr:hypothetical protein C0Q70_04947 [Pomacea canaliculata]
MTVASVPAKSKSIAVASKLVGESVQPLGAGTASCMQENTAVGTARLGAAILTAQRWSAKLQQQRSGRTTSQHRLTRVTPL